MGGQSVIANSSIPIAPLVEAIEHLADAFAIYDPSDRLVYCNDGYRHIFGDKAPPNLIGMTFDQIAQYCLQNGLYPDAAGREEAYLAERLANHRAETSVLEQVLPDGRVERIHEMTLPSGHKLGLHSIVTELVEARRAAQEASRAKSRFLANMSHEIRTPLVGILGMVDLLLDGPMEADHRPMLRIIQQSGETLLRIVNDVLDMAKIEAGKMRLSATAFDPMVHACPVVERYQIRAAQKGVTLTCTRQEDQPLLRMGDDLRIGQLLDNLLSNAVKFTEAGEIHVTLRNVPGEPFAITVQDSGIGMTEDQVERIMLPFEQADDSSTRRYGGTGLGMSIVRYILDSLGGALTISSQPGRGTTFVVTLPLPEAQQTAAPYLPSLEPEPVSLLDRRVLVADDNEINRTILSGFLSKIGAVPTMVEDGAQAVAAAMDDAFDLICLDVSMPVLDGVGALRQIRCILGAACPPIIAVTAHAMDHQVAEYAAAGFDGHLAKPFHRADLESIMQRLLATRPPRL